MKRIISKALPAALLSLALGAFTGAAQAGTTAEEAIEAAKGAQTKANSIGGEWRDTDKMIKKAEALLAEGKAEEAKKMAEKALDQGILGYEQAKSQTADNLHI